MKTLESNTTQRESCHCTKKVFDLWCAPGARCALLFLRRKQCGYMEIYASKEYQRVCIIQKKLMRVLLSDLKKSLRKKKNPLFKCCCLLLFLAESPCRLALFFSMPNRLKLLVFPQRSNSTFVVQMFDSLYMAYRLCENAEIHWCGQRANSDSFTAPQVSLFVLWFYFSNPENT